MANISDAYGMVTIFAKRTEDCKLILKLFSKNLELGEYCTIFETDSTRLASTEEGAILECDFIASGRWCYANNIERSCYWIKPGLNKKELEALESLDWIMLYDYVDYEPGFELLGQFTCNITHKAGEKLEDSQYQELGGEVPEYSLFNIKELMGYSLNDLFEEKNLWYDNLVEDEDYVEYFKDDFSQLIHDYAIEWKTTTEEVKNRFSKEIDDFDKIYDLFMGDTD